MGVIACFRQLYANEEAHIINGAESCAADRALEILQNAETKDGE
jgi:hypothetical protein